MTIAEVIDFKTGLRRRDRQAGCDEVHRRLTQLLAGDRDAASWLYDTFSSSLFRRLRRRYGHLEGVEPDDLLHDAFVFYFQRDGKVLRDFLDRVIREEQTPQRLERHLWDLACGIASNRRRRAAALRDLRPAEISAEDSEIEDDTHEQLMLDRDELSRLDACLNDYGPRLYLYYRLRYWDGYSPREIAAMTGWSQKVTYKLRQSLNEAVRSCVDQLGMKHRN